MKARARITVAFVVAALVVGAGLAWLQWPPGGRGPANATPTESRQARIEALRAQIERELQRLNAAREQHDLSAAELRALEASLEDSRERVEQLRRELETGAANGS